MPYYKRNIEEISHDYETPVLHAGFFGIPKSTEQRLTQGQYLYHQFEFFLNSAVDLLCFQNQLYPAC